MESRQRTTVAGVSPLPLDKNLVARCPTLLKSEESGSETNNMLETDSEETGELERSSSLDDFLPSSSKDMHTDNFSQPGTPFYLARDSNSLTFQWEISKANSPTQAFPLYIVDMQQVEVSAGSTTPDGGTARSLVDPALWNVVYTGTECWTQIKPLRPGRYYAVQVRCDWSYEKKLISVKSPIAVFHTTPTIPIAPQPPALIGLESTSLELKWMNPVEDGGSGITGFTLQLKSGVSDNEEFADVYVGSEDSIIITDLMPFTKYTVRIKAANEVGEGPWSLCSCFKTKALSPVPPFDLIGHCLSPTVVHLEWKSSPQKSRNLEIYEVEVEDEKTGFCFYRKQGNETECEISELKSETEYRFRVRAINEVGAGDWSSDFRLCTEGLLPGCPSCPILVSCLETEASFAWHPPLDNGGKPVDQYQAEMMSISPRVVKGNIRQSWQVVYKGYMSKCYVKDLHPGCDYHIRVKAKTKNGWSLPSLILQFQTLPGTSDKPFVPHAVERYDTSIRVYWMAPADDGGQQIDLYRLECCPVSDLKVREDALEEDPFMEVYKGWRNQVDLTNLIPGTVYALRVQAINQIGASEWSDIGYESTKAGPPASPTSLTISLLHQDQFQVCWKTPKSNGAAISGFTLVLAKLDKHHPVFVEQEDQELDLSDLPSILSSWYDRYGQELEELDKNLDFQEVYNGASTECILSSLDPNFDYLMKMKAKNKHGDSPWSRLFPLKLDSYISKMESLEDFKAEEIGYTTMKLSWRFHKIKKSSSVFIVEMKSSKKEDSDWLEVWKGDQCCCLLENLDSGENYLFRVLEDSQGSDYCSQEISLQTKLYLPETPEEVKISQITPTSIKIDWKQPLLSVLEEISKSKNSNFHFILSLQNLKDMKSDPILLTLPSTNSFIRMGNLTPNTDYEVKLAAENKIGRSQWSPKIICRTKLNPPLPPTDIQVTLSDDHQDLRVEVDWKLSMENNGENYEAEKFEIEVTVVNSKKLKNSQQQVFTKVLTCSTPWNFENFERNQKYEIRVRGVSQTGTAGRWSKSVMIDTSPPSQEEEKLPLKENSESILVEDKKTSNEQEDGELSVGTNQQHQHTRRMKKGQVAVPQKRMNPFKKKKPIWRSLRPYLTVYISLFMLIFISILIFYTPAHSI